MALVERGGDPMLRLGRVEVSQTHGNFVAEGAHY